MPLLDDEEYIEQAFFFDSMRLRLKRSEPIQDVLEQIEDEILATTNLPKALSFMLTELNHAGTMSTAMYRLSHYFTPFQSYLISEAEKEEGRFGMQMALEILHHEAIFRSQKPTPQGSFFYQFESLCRNRLDYDAGLLSIANDPIYNRDWMTWIMKIRRTIGMVDLTDQVYICSEYYLKQQTRLGHTEFEAPESILFGPKEGKIALANRKKEPTFFFDALQRQLKYPRVPRPTKRDETVDLLPKLARQMERIEQRIKLLEDEQRQSGIDLTKFYEPPSPGG